MKKTTLIIMALSATITMSACSNGGGSADDGTPKAIPEDLSFAPQGNGLSAEDKSYLTEFFAAFKTKKDQDIPSKLPDFLMPSKNEDVADRKEREEAYAKLSKAQKNQVEQARAACVLNEKSTPDINFDDPTPGKLQTTTSQKTLSGTNCPVSASSNNSTSMKYTQVDPQAHHAVLQLTRTMDEVTTVKNPGSEPMTIVSASNSMHLNAMAETTASSSSVYGIGPAHVSYNLTGGQTIVIDGQIETLKTSKVERVLVYGTITVNGRQYTLSGYNGTGSDLSTPGTDIYINGEKMPASLFKN